MMMLRGILFFAFLWYALLPLAAQSQTDGSLGLDHIVLDMSPNQIAGRPFVGTARLLLMDAQNNLQYDYNLALNPIVLHTLGGSLFPSIINDHAYLDSGVIDLTRIGVKYNGPTGQVPISASSGLITSSSVLVNFLGYDAVGVTNFRGDSIKQFFSGHLDTIRVIVRNGGNQLPDTIPSIRAFFASGGGSTRVFFPPDYNGAEDTISLGILPGVPAGSDTLVITVTSRYLIDTAQYTARDTLRVPVTVLPPTDISLLPGSTRPDSVYAGDTFLVSFDMSAPGFQGSVDSGYVKLDLADRVGHQVTVIYDGPAYSTGVENEVIHYSGLPSEVSLAAGLLPGWYHLRMKFDLVSGGSVFSLSTFQADSVFLMPFTMPQYIPGTFAPDTVAAGSLAEFRFELAVTDTFPLQVDPAPGRATFTITGGPDYLQTGNLIIPNFTLNPGRNIVRTDKFFIPQSQLDSQLTVSATIRFAQPRDSIFSSTFDGQLVTVKELPIAQIISANIVAPNAPKVNVNQPYGVLVSVANVSNSPIDNLVLRLTSDGNSIDSLLDTVPLIPTNDTVDIMFPVVSREADSLELFKADIVSDHHGQLLPIDNVAAAQIQVPASIRLSPTLNHQPNDSVAPFFYATGSNLDLGITVLNLGGADASPASYHLSTDNIDIAVLRPNWDTLGDMTVGIQGGRVFRLMMPDFDTSFTVTFVMTTRPTDLNTGLPAIVTGDTVVSYRINVASTSAQLFVESVPGQSVPLYRNRLLPLLQLRVEDIAQSVVNTVQIDSVRLRVSTSADIPKSAAEVFDPDSIGFYDGTKKVGTGRLRDDQIIVVFDSFLVAVGEEKLLTLKGSVVAGEGQTFHLQLDTAGVEAKYTDGPALGRSVAIGAPPNGGSILKKLFTVSGETLAQSFKIENNPWHPEAGNARFAYSLQRESAMDFRIFTLGGELVLEKHISQADPLASAGSHILEWDGGNGSGKVVLDGVYIVSLTALAMGQEVRIKVAVVK